MTDNVQVLIKCANCGDPLVQMVARYGGIVRMPGEHERCPHCAKLTYGPLTEEMVAEALRQAAYGEPQPKWPPTHLATEFGSQARFVLRLLNDLYPKGGLGLSSPSGGGGNEWRDWLLDLARQK